MQHKPVEFMLLQRCTHAYSTYLSTNRELVAVNSHCYGGLILPRTIATIGSVSTPELTSGSILKLNIGSMKGGTVNSWQELSGALVKYLRLLPELRFK